MFTALLLVVVCSFVIVAIGVVAGIVSYLRDPQAMIRREQYRENLAKLDSLV